MADEDIKTYTLDLSSKYYGYHQTYNDTFTGYNDYKSYTYTAPNSSCYVIQTVPRSEWVCELFGTGRSLVLRPAKGKEPNWFWRQMQYICFGNKWKKEPEYNF